MSSTFTVIQVGVDLPVEYYSGEYGLTSNECTLNGNLYSDRVCLNADGTYCVNDYTFLEVLYVDNTGTDGNEMTNRLSFSPNLDYSIVLDLKENG